MFHQPIVAGSIHRAEILASFSYALDLTEGQPEGHSLRCCWIGMQVGQELGLTKQAQHDLYYTLLLKDLGCSSNAARICELYEADDRAFKMGYKTVGTSLAATLHFVFSRTAVGRPLHRRALAIGKILANGDRIAQEMIVARCTRGADIAADLRFSDAVCDGIYHLDEHWDGSGRPDQLRREDIPTLARIALLAQIADVFHSHAGPSAAIDEVRRRSGSWLDPTIVDAFERVGADNELWELLGSPLLPARVVALAPTDEAIGIDESYLDSVAAAFGQVIDAKSPFTSGHSARVGEYSVALGERMGLDQSRIGPLRRAALLHDVGKLGVSSSVLEKPASLDDREWAEMRAHAEHTRAILGRIGVMAHLADLAAAHHERLDGAGYPRRLAGSAIPVETRIITVCDIFDALTADRPYRAALPCREALTIMAEMVGTAIDGHCFRALEEHVGDHRDRLEVACD